LAFRRLSVYAVAGSPVARIVSYRSFVAAEGVRGSRHGRGTRVNRRLTDETDVTRPARDAETLGSVRGSDFDGILQKLKLLEFGLYGLQQYGRSAPLDVEDLGPFYRLAEEIQGDVLALQERVAPRPMIEPDA
jgi:hypothetical protein